MLLPLCHALMALLLVFAAVMQGNDPDPLPWLLMYGAAAVVAVWGLLGRPPAAAAVALALLAGVWSLALSPGLAVFLARDLSATRFSMPAGDVIEEEARECLGLLLVVVSSLLLVMDANGRRRRFIREGRS